MKYTLFSNGQKDIYKGKRDIKAGWQVTFPNGGTASGHSYDKAAAEKTARSHISMNSPAYYPSPAKLKYATCANYWNKIAKDGGFKSVNELVAQGKAENAAFAAKCKVEIVDVKEE